MKSVAPKNTLKKIKTTKPPNHGTLETNNLLKTSFLAFLKRVSVTGIINSCNGHEYPRHMQYKEYQLQSIFEDMKQIFLL